MLSKKMIGDQREERGEGERALATYLWCCTELMHMRSSTARNSSQNIRFACVRFKCDMKPA